MGLREALICMPLRTAIARENGQLRSLLPEEMGGQVIRTLIESTGVAPSAVDDVVVGNQFSSPRMGRHCALLGGLPVEVPGVAVNRACGSGLQAIANAALSVQTGRDELVIAGGTESYTRAPFLMEKPSEAFPRQPPRFLGGDSRGDFGMPDLGLQTPMGQTAENVAEAYGVSREDQDAFALESQRRAARAMASGVLAEEIVPVEAPARGGEIRTFDTDECPRPDTSLERLSRLPPAFRRGGTVTAGNSCKRSDAASMMLVASPEGVARHRLDPIGRFVEVAHVGLHPNLMGMGPVPAVRKLLSKTGIGLDEIGLIELNEAFAAQAVPVIRELKLDPLRVNVNGGAIAFGHPIGATGAILTTKLLREMRRRNIRYGIVTMCIGGGMGMAALFEHVA